MVHLDMPVLERFQHHTPHKFLPPVKRITDGQDVSSFLVSTAYRDIVIFISQLNRSMFPVHVHDNSNNQSDIKPVAPKISLSPDTTLETGLAALLGTLNDMIDEIPPDDAPRRFGNMSFRLWSGRLKQRAESLLAKHIPKSLLHFSPVSRESKDVAMTELKAYFLGSFGSSQRLDYGTGHELSFVAFIGSLWKLGGWKAEGPELTEANSRSIVLHTIEPYLALVRRLIRTYTLEPAGSHGVWGLDDHSFLPYIFGSAQYGPPRPYDAPAPVEGSDSRAPDPSNVTKPEFVEKERSQNMYFGAIGFIYDVKTGPFWEHSRILYDISGVQTGWAKINKGMIKMYKAEVLSKFPVVQHFPFGSIFSWERDPNAIEPPVSAHATSRPSFKPSDQVSISTAAMRSPPDYSTKAPWIIPVSKKPVSKKPILMPDTQAPRTSKQQLPKFLPTTVAAVGRENSLDTHPPARTSRSNSTDTQAPWASKQRLPSFLPTTIPYQGRLSDPDTQPPARTSRANSIIQFPPQTRKVSDQSSPDGTLFIRTDGNQTQTYAGPMPPPTRAPWADPESSI